MTDSDLEAAIDRAAERLARHLAHVTSLADPTTTARQWIVELIDSADHWRPVPAGPDWRQPSPPPPPGVYERGLAEARRALNPTREDMP